MSFHNAAKLPVDIERGAVGGPGFKTTIIETSGGFEKRNQDWARTRGRWDIGYGLRSKADNAEVLAFFYARRGRAYGFRFKDWSDFEAGSVATPQFLALGDAVTVAFQMFKRYTSFGTDYDRKLTRPVNGTVAVYLNGVLKSEGPDYTVNYDTGVITFASAPAVKATGLLTITANPTNGETVTIGSKVYTFQTTLTNVDGNVKIGASASASRDNLVAAITLGAGSGTAYAAATTVHPTVTATAASGNNMNAIAKTAGAAGNAIATTETLANGSWGAAALTGGTDVTISYRTEFDVPVRFDTDELSITAEIYDVQAVPSIPLIELKE